MENTPIIYKLYKGKSVMEILEMYRTQIMISLDLTQAVGQQHRAVWSRTVAQQGSHMWGSSNRW